MDKWSACALVALGCTSAALDPGDPKIDPSPPDLDADAELAMEFARRLHAEPTDTSATLGGKGAGAFWRDLESAVGADPLAVGTIEPSEWRPWSGTSEVRDIRYAVNVGDLGDVLVACGRAGRQSPTSPTSSYLIMSMHLGLDGGGACPTWTRYPHLSEFPTFQAIDTLSSEDREAATAAQAALVLPVEGAAPPLAQAWSDLLATVGTLGQFPTVPDSGADIFSVDRSTDTVRVSLVRSAIVFERLKCTSIFLLSTSRIDGAGAATKATPESVGVAISLSIQCV